MKVFDSTIQFSGINSKSLTNSLNILYTVSFFCFYYSHISTWTEFQTLKSFNSVIYPVFLCLSVFFLLLSGANFRLNTYNAPGESAQTEKYRILPFVTIILFGCSIKSMLLFGSHQFFRWEAPHTILTCILLIFLLSQFRLYMVYLLFLIVIFFRLDLFEILNPVLLKLTDSEFIFSAVADTIILKSLILLIFFWMHLKLSKFLHLRSQVKLGFYLIFLLISYFWLSSGRYFRSSEISVFKSLPYGILIGDSRASQHAFGLIFWLPIVFAGFILSDLMLKLKNHKFLNFTFFMTSFLILIYLLYTSATLQTNSQFFSVADLGNEFMMDPASSNTLLFSSLFITFIYGLHYCHRLQDLKFFKIISQSVFYQYIFLTLFGAKICSEITFLAPNHRFTVSLFVLIFLGVGLAYIINYITSFKIEFTVKPGFKNRKAIAMKNER